MAVLREDVVQIGFDIEMKKLLEVKEMLDEVKKIAGGGIGEDAFDEMVKESKKAADGLDDVKDAAKKVKPAGIDDAKEAAKKLKTNLSKVEDVLGKVAKKAASITFKGLANFAKLSFTAVTAGVTAAGAAVWNFANLASDLDETKNKVDVAFGAGNGAFEGASASVMEWSKKSTTEMGLAQQTALDTAALFGDIGTSMGLTKDASAEMSMALTQQAADLASFKNLGIEEVTTALNGVFTGETESLKRLGVVMTQTNLENYALEKGIGKTLDKMTEAEKVQLRYNYVMEKTANATGDYKRTGGGFANQLRTLTENLKQLGTVLGGLPMTKFASGMKVINDALAEVQAILSDGIQDGDLDKIMDIATGLLDKGIKALSDGIPKVMPAVIEVLSTVAEGVVKALPKIAPVLAQGTAKLMVGLGKILIDNLPELIQAAKEVISEFAKAIAEELGGGNFAKTAFSADTIGKVLTGLVAALGGGFAAFKGFKAFQSIKSLFGGKDKENPLGDGDKSGKSGLLGSFKELAKMKTTDVLKGMANLAIIIGGLAILAVALIAIAPYVAQLSDMGSILKVIGTMALLGVLGAVLAKEAGAIGKIPVKTVLLGLANMAIILVGFGAVAAAFLWLSPYMAGLGDMQSILKVCGVMVLLGVLGTVLSALAAIIGLIPIPVVLLGLANMAIVLVGFGAVAAAFLWLAPYMAAMGDMQDILKVIAVMTLLGTLGGVLSIFAGVIGLIPMPIVLAGLANMALVLAGLGALCASLQELASDEMIATFTKIASIPTRAFTSMGLLFGALAEINNLPKSGGIAQWFTGETSLSTMGKELADFAENAQPFFTAVGTLDAGSIFAFFATLSKGAALPEKLEGLNGTLGKSLGGMVDTIKGIVPAMFSAGAQALQGLNRGLQSMIPTLTATAVRAANAIKIATDDALDIHSPSRVMFGSGRNAGLGQVNGLRSAIPDMQAASVEVATASIPYSSSYTPENSVSTYTTNSSNTEYTTISPVFNLTVSGSNDDRATARKVKRYVAEAIRETFESMGRTGRSYREV